jgi:hypothetical protein
MTNPTTPESPSQNQRSGAALSGTKLPVMMKWAMQRNMAATTSLPRLTLAEPMRAPLNVKKVEPKAQQRAVLKAAISPNTGLK